MEFAVLGIFCICLILCITYNISILYALLFGLMLFSFYGNQKGFTWRELFTMAINGIKTVKNILITFILIGILTALWRAAGTIPYIVCHAIKLIRPSIFLLMTFLLNCGLSFLTGTSFGTASTMGVICASIGAALNISPVFTGGAILSGAFFGDRCSPVSTSALLVSSVTGTDIYKNIQRMLYNAFVPFIFTCLIYLCLGTLIPNQGTVLELEPIFSRIFHMNWITVIPSVIILIASISRINVKLAMSLSILSAVLICLIIQEYSFIDVLRFSVIGFYPKDENLVSMMSGGGIFSMLKVSCIVCISSAYSDLLNKTGLLDNIKAAVISFAVKTSAYTATLLSSLFSCMIACNQTLAILLTNQLCKDLYKDHKDLAVDIEDTAVIIAPLVPWSIAGAVPLSAADVPMTAIFTSFFLIILPVYRMLTEILKNKGL